MTYSLQDNLFRLAGVNRAIHKRVLELVQHPVCVTLWLLCVSPVLKDVVLTHQVRLLVRHGHHELVQLIPMSLETVSSDTDVLR